MLVYDSLEQARMRLQNTTITVGSKAFYVSDITQGRGATSKIKVKGYFYPLRPTVPEKQETFDLDDPSLNFRRFRVGYLNQPNSLSGSKAPGGSAVFVTRDTNRQQLQGLNRRALFANNNGLGEYSFFSQEFEDMLFDRYPTVEEALAMIMEDDWTSVAVSRSFAIGVEPEHKGLRLLKYRGRTVGLAVGKSFAHFVVDNSDKYLREALTEAGFPFVVEE